MAACVEMITFVKSLRLAGNKDLLLSLLAAMIRQCKSESDPSDVETRIGRNYPKMHSEDKQVQKKK